MKRLISTWLVLGFVLLLTGGVRAEQLTYVDILKQLTDLDRLARLQEGVTAGQFSSHARGEHEKWATNADAGQYIRVEENGEAVMMEQDGPGCIYRMWSANPQGKLHIYLDGATEPSLVLDHNGMYTSGEPPFIKPLVYKRGDERSASDSYVPIPFAKSIKICADERRGQFYIFDYLKYPADWEVESFHLPLTEAETAVLNAAAEVWAKPGTDPKPKLPGQRTISKTITLKPGQTAHLAQLAGPGSVRAIRMKVDCEQRSFWRKLVLQGVWDGAGWPQVEAPVGGFFGFDWQMPEYGALPAGCKDGQCYFYYPMPFRESAALRLTSYLELPATVSYEIEWAPADPPEDMAYFFARWRHEVDSKSLDYPFIEVAGEGRLVGVTLQVDHPIPGWWGEGDEKVWVDGDQFPPWIGTGSEDYFGDAWGIRYLSEPSFGCSFDQYPHTCPYRWHFMDMIPFSRRLRMTIENYGAWPKLDFDEFEYNSVAYWYQAELTPPFEKLAGKTYTGGEVYQQTPATYEYRTDRFPAITADDVRTSGLDIPFAVEAEDILANSANAKIITDAQLPYELNWERAVDFGEVQAGDMLAEFTLKAGPAGAYLPTLYTAPADGTAELALQVAGTQVGVINRPEPHIAELDGVLLPEGGDTARLVATTDGRAIIDCLRLEPAPKVEGAIEAEDVAIVRWESGEAPHPSPALRGPSGGRILEWHAAAVGDSLVLKVPRESQAAHVLGVRAMNGPGGGIIEAFADGKPLGPQFDLYAAEKHPGPTIWPLGPVPGEGEVEIRVVGKNPAATAYHVGLDYFRWEPLIIHPESAAGVWAQVLRTDRCQYRTQDLGDRFVGGHHLWLQPCRENGYVDIGLMIPEEGDYTLQTRYTTSHDYAILQASLDEEPLGDRVDLYTPTVLQTEPIDLGTHHLTAGQHVLRFQAVGKNEGSTGYLMGIDYVLVRKAG